MRRQDPQPFRPGPVRCAARAADFYKDKTVTIIVGFTPGGGYDVYARVLARYWGRYLPGNPAFVVKNMPGAGGLTMANYIYNQSPRDGSEIATMQSGVVFEKLYHTLSPGGANARFEAEKFGWIGSALRSTYVTITWHDSPVKTLEDAKVYAEQMAKRDPYQTLEIYTCTHNLAAELPIVYYGENGKKK